MKIFYSIFDNNGDCLTDDFPITITPEIRELSRSKKHFIAEIDNKPTNCRIGFKSFDNGYIYILTHEERLVKRYKFFEEIIERSKYIFDASYNARKNLIDEHRQRLDIFMHNIISLNTYTIQSLFSLIPQKELPENINQQKDFIKKMITEKPNITVDTILKLIKNAIATKIEFTVFDRINNPTTILNIYSHSIRESILTILQIFNDDFEKKGINVHLESSEISERRLDIDNEALFVSLFYLFENSVKYCLSKSKYYINFIEDVDSFTVYFRMTSVKIEEEEKEKLLVYGYRSDNAKKLDIDGKGIGMHRIVKTLKLNNAILQVNPNYNKYERELNGIIFQSNEFGIIFKNQKKYLMQQGKF